MTAGRVHRLAAMLRAASLASAPSPAMSMRVHMAYRQRVGMRTLTTGADTPTAPASSASSSDASVSTATLADASGVGVTFAETGAYYLDTFHTLVSQDGALFPWAPSIMLCALAIRTLSAPLLYYQQMHAGRRALAARELPRVQAFVRQTPGSLLQKYLTFRRLRALALRSAGTSGLQGFRWDLVVHLPVVVAASMGIRKLAAAQPQQWREGGLAWFPDLTVPDPTGALPVVTTAFWLWNCSPRTALTTGGKAEGGEGRESGEGKEGEQGNKGSNATINRVMSSRGEWVSTLLQVVSVASLTVTMDLPAGIVLLWASNGAVTAAQRWALSNDAVRRHLGLLTAQDIAASSGPDVLQGTKTAVEQVRRELEYVQREVLRQFPNREVDVALKNEINSALKRELWNRRISMQLQAIIREDDKNGKKYIAVVPKGAA